MPLPLNPFLAAILGQAQSPPVVDPTKPKVTSMKPRVKGGVADYSATLGPAWSTENRGEHPAQTIVDRSGGGERIALGPIDGAFAPLVGAGEKPWPGYAASPIQTTIYRAEPGTREFVFRHPPPGPTPGVNLADPGARAQFQDQLGQQAALLRAMGVAGASTYNSPQFATMNQEYGAGMGQLTEQGKTEAARTQANALAQQAATGERTADEDLAIKRLTAQAQLAEAEARGRQAVAAEAESRLRSDPATLFRGNPEAISADPLGAFRALGPSVPHGLLLGVAGIKLEDPYETALQKLQAGGYGALPEATAETPYAEWTDPNIIRRAMGVQYGPRIAEQLASKPTWHMTPGWAEAARKTREGTRQLFGGGQPAGLLSVPSGASRQDTPLATGQPEPPGLAPAPVINPGVLTGGTRKPAVRVKKRPATMFGMTPETARGFLGSMFRPY